MPKLLVKNSSDRELSEVLKERNIDFTVEPYNEFLGFSVTMSQYYQYEKDGVPRHAYEVAIRYVIDDYIIKNVIFDAPATREEVIDAFNQE